MKTVFFLIVTGLYNGQPFAEIYDLYGSRKDCEVGIMETRKKELNKAVTAVGLACAEVAPAPGKPV
jgi:hypothetical protein